MRNAAPADAAAPAGWLLPAALAYTAFPVYGSLVPFDLRSQPVGPALQRFAELLGGPLEVASRADFAANVLLAVPLALLWLAVLVVVLPGLRSVAARALAGAAVWLLCSAFALALEFSQLFFGGRDPALSDCVAQSLGAALGVLAWPIVPDSFWRRGDGARTAWPQAAGVYLVGLVLYALMPLDLTVSRSDLADKLRAGMLHLRPFDGWAAAPLSAAVGFGLDICLWAAAMLLLRKARPGRRRRDAAGLLALAVGLECAQLFVMSRVVDVTDVIAAALGIGAAARFAPGGRLQPARGALRSGGGLAARSALVLLAAAAILAVNAYPYEFVAGLPALRERLAAVSPLPFDSYRSSTELSLVTSLLRRLFEFGAFAFLLQWALQCSTLPPRWRPAATAAACATLALAVETLQLLLPGSVVDGGDVLLAAAVGAVAAAWARRLSAGSAAGSTVAIATATATGARARPVAQPADTGRRRRPAALAADPFARLDARRLQQAAAVAAMLLLLGLFLLGRLPQVPYNLRELVAPAGAPWAAPVVAPVLLALFGAPALAARAAAGSGLGVPTGRTLALLVGTPTALATLLYLGVARESVHDVVGSPVLGAWPAAETVGRLAVLLLGATWSLALGGALAGPTVRAGRRAAGVVHLLAHGIWIVPLWHGVVVSAAATDNLTELMVDDGGAASTLCLLSYATLPAATAGLLFAAWRAPSAGWKRLLGAAALLAASVGAGYLLVVLGTQPVLVKYGRTFSALQFLLSAGRDAYAAPAGLLLRFALAHLGVVTAATAGLLVAGAAIARRGDVTGGRIIRRDRAPVAATAARCS